MGNYFVNGNRVEDQSVQQVLDRLATSTDAGVRNLVRDGRIDSVAEANRLVNVSSSGLPLDEVVNADDMNILNRGLGERRLEAHQFGTLAHYLQQQFGSANSGRSIPVVDPRLFEGLPEPAIPEEFRRLAFSTILKDRVPTLLTPFFAPDGTPVNFSASPTDTRLVADFEVPPRFTRIKTSTNGNKATFSIETNYGERGVYEFDRSGDKVTYTEYAQGRQVGQFTFGYRGALVQTLLGTGREGVSGEPGASPPRTDAVASALESVARAEGGENRVHSSYSVLDALHLLLGGLNEAQYQEVARRLGLNPDVRQQLAEAKALRGSLASTPDVTLTVANRVYAIPGSLQPDYVRTLEEFFESKGYEHVDFRSNPEQARRMINEWVSRQTNGLIPELLVSGTINQDTAFVLVNALYFKGKWAHPFDRKETRDAPFLTARGTRVTVPMMRQQGNFGYLNTDDYEVVELPYGDPDNPSMSMIAVLPAEGSDWHPDEAFYRDVRAQLAKQNIILALPRFTARTTLKLDKAFPALGLRGLDYSRMIKGRTDRLEGVTKVVFKVDEEGAEGAAATAFFLTRGTAPPTFRADRPFYFAVVHRDTGTILFSGQVADPSEGSR